MTTDAASKVGCGTARPDPRRCGDFSIPDTQVLEFGRTRAAIEVGDCRIELIPGAETTWAVAEVLAA